MARTCKNRLTSISTAMISLHLSGAASGLPIGNLTSQFFANVYLDGFDHFVTEILQAPYVRYVDDFALFHNDPAILAEWWLRIELYLAGRRLKLHPRKTMILSCTEPSQFLGFELHADRRRRLPEVNVRRFRNRLRGLRDQWRAGTIGFGDIKTRVEAWIAHAKHADTWRLRHAIFRGGRFDPANDLEAWTAPCCRVVRGGSWNNNPQNLRAANRNRNTTDNRNNNLGFRWEHAFRQSQRDYGRAGRALTSRAVHDEHDRGPRRSECPIPRWRLSWLTHGATGATGLFGV